MYFNTKYLKYYFYKSFRFIFRSPIFLFLLGLIIFLVFKYFDESLMLCDDGEVEAKAETEDELVARLEAEADAEDEAEDETYIEKVDRL
jgi:hypothetical protein